MTEPGRSVDYHIIDVNYNRPLRNNLGVNTTDGFTYSIADMKPDEIKISDLIDNIWTYNRESVFEPNGIDRNELQIMATPDGPYEHEVVLDGGSIVRETMDTHTNYKLSPYVGTTTARPLADSVDLEWDDLAARFATLQAQAPPLPDDLEARFAALQAQHPVLPSGGDQATGSVDLGDLEARFYALFPEDQMGDQDQAAIPRAESQPDLSPVDPDFNDLEVRYNALVGRGIDGGGRRHMKRKSKKKKSKRRNKTKRRKSKRRKSKRRNKTKRR